MELTHWKLLIDPNYFGAYALPGGNDLTATIDRVERKQITLAGGKKEDHTIAHLVGLKPLILNVTNSKSIHKLYGPYIENWAGQQITLYASTTKMGPEIVECVRVRPTVTQPEKSPISPARFAVAMQKVMDGSYPADKLRSGFALTPEQDSELTEAMKGTQ
jgi:hypothetical protein